MTGIPQRSTPADAPVTHLYFHIPFCPKICPYCSFYKEASDRNKTAAFIDALLLELERATRAHPVVPETIFFGGGTPSALSTPQLDRLLSGIRNLLPLSALREWTLEMNPATVSAEKARLLLDLGVNRISMGVQSWDESLLQTLGRVHNTTQARRSYDILRESGVPNVNLDLIFGIPGQSPAQWRDSLEQTIALQPDHISCYCLTYEEDTEFFRRLQNGDLTQDEGIDAILFETTMETLEAAGYPQYEISNYARPGRECHHNLAYWTGADYLGFGPSAWSTRADLRWQNTPDTAAYTAAILNGTSAASNTERLTPATRNAERIAFSLRTRAGVPADDLAEHAPQLDELESLNLITRTAGRVALTRNGRLLADEIASAFV